VKKGQLLMELELDKEQIEQLTLEVQKKEQDIELLTIKLGHETDKDPALKAELQNIASDLAAIENGTYALLKKSRYGLNIGTAEKNLKDKQALFDAGAISRSEVDEAADSLAIAHMEYEQYLQSEKENKTELLKNKQEQLNSLHYTMRDLGFQINNGQLELRVLKNKLAQAENGGIMAETDGFVMTVNVEKGAFAPGTIFCCR
jgi:Multidrug resistance efflux pump